MRYSNLLETLDKKLFSPSSPEEEAFFVQVEEAIIDLEETITKLSEDFSKANQAALAQAKLLERERVALCLDLKKLLNKECRLIKEEDAQGYIVEDVVDIVDKLSKGEYYGY